MNTSVPDLKRTVRAAGLTARRMLSKTARDAANVSIVRRLLDLPELHGARNVLLYAATDHEVDLSAAGAAFRSRGAQTLYPRVADADLEVVAVTTPDTLHPGYRGIPEPVGEALDPAHIEVVVLPGVAFDQHGGRLGWGKGFYDRFLLTVPRNALRIGTCFAVQVTEDIPREPHDQPVDVLVTETTVIRPRQRPRRPFHAV